MPATERKFKAPMHFMLSQECFNVGFLQATHIRKRHLLFFLNGGQFTCSVKIGQNKNT